MLIKALCDYYDILADGGKLLPEDYSQVGIHYVISLTPDGKIEDIVDYQLREHITDKKGKTKEINNARLVNLPRRTEKTGIDPNIIEHRPVYIFGLNLDDTGFTDADKTNKAKKSHEAFKEANLRFLEGLDSPVANAYRAFIESWVPSDEVNNPHLLGIGKNYKNLSFGFCLNGNLGLLLHDDPIIKAKWEREFAARNAASDSEVTAQCAVTGSKEPIARIHNKISGIIGGLPTGSVFIGYKNTAGCSYGNEQSYNSNISETAMKKYTAALNYLLKDKNHKNSIDNITVVYWSADKNDACSQFVSQAVFGDDFGDDFGGSAPADKSDTDNSLKGIMQSAYSGKLVQDSFSFLKDVDTNVDFYIVGMKPNSARVAVKFIYHRKFGEVFQNIVMHQTDMQISANGKPVSMNRLKKELIPLKSSNAEIDSSLLAEIFNAVINGTNYPPFLLSTLVMRAKVDRDINYVRAGAIKACINRTSRLNNQKEELTMSLDKNNNDQAYLCGRLFAALEKLQQEASNDSLNRTIKNAYFASAATKPATVFPTLLKLSQNHMKNLKKKSDNTATKFSDLIIEIMDGIEGKFPDTLTLTEQGTFMVGYYQQLPAAPRLFKNNNNDDNKNKEEK